MASTCDTARSYNKQMVTNIRKETRHPMRYASDIYYSGIFIVVKVDEEEIDITNILIEHGWELTDAGELGDLQTERNDLTHKCLQLEDERDDLLGQVDNLEKERDDLRDDKIFLQEEVGILRQEVSDLQADLQVAG